jgi:hypothetical protein
MIITPQVTHDCCLLPDFFDAVSAELGHYQWSKLMDDGGVRGLMLLCRSWRCDTLPQLAERRTPPLVDVAGESLLYDGFMPIKGIIGYVKENDPSHDRTL